eukprot:5860847-Karenia_brevis.AAC.1
MYVPRLLEPFMQTSVPLFSFIRPRRHPDCRVPSSILRARLRPCSSLLLRLPLSSFALVPPRASSSRRHPSSRHPRSRFPIRRSPRSCLAVSPCPPLLVAVPPC